MIASGLLAFAISCVPALDGAHLSGLSFSGRSTPAARSTPGQQSSTNNAAVLTGSASIGKYSGITLQPEMPQALGR